MTNSDNIFNMSTIDELKEVLEDDIVSIYEEFASTTQPMLNDLKAAAKDDDTDTLFHIAHTIKGSSGNLGLQRISGICQEIETELRLDNKVDTQNMITKLEFALEETLIELRAMKLLAE